MIVPPLSAHAHIGGFAHVVHRQISAAAPSSSEAGDGAVISAEDLIHTADEHWNVSGASVIAAWLLDTEEKALAGEELDPRELLTILLRVLPPWYTGVGPDDPIPEVPVRVDDEPGPTA